MKRFLVGDKVRVRKGMIKGELEYGVEYIVDSLYLNEHADLMIDVRKESLFLNGFFASRFELVKKKEKKEVGITKFWAKIEKEKENA